MNQMKQIMLAAHHFASTHNGRLPSPSSSFAQDGVFFSDVADYLDRATFVQVDQTVIHGISHPVLKVMMYRCPADPSFDSFSSTDPTGYFFGDSSYAANMVALAGAPYLDRAFPDGTAYTMAIGEHYARCGNRGFAYEVEGLNINVQTGKPGPGPRRATFADAQNEDVVPAINAPRGATIGPQVGKTFQVSPSMLNCDSSIPQTPHVGGMVTAMVDGSVRIVSKSVSSETFWAAVSPNGGEVLGKDW